MTAMGQRLQADETVYSAWFPRGGDYAVFRAQLIDKAASGTPSLTITFYHKNQEDAGDGDEVSAGGGLDLELTNSNSPGDVASVDLGNVGGAAYPVKELVRLKLACSGNWMRFQMLQPAWYNWARV
jgi:hypothetical protein